MSATTASGRGLRDRRRGGRRRCLAWSYPAEVDRALRRLWRGSVGGEWPAARARDERAPGRLAVAAVAVLALAALGGCAKHEAPPPPVRPVQLVAVQTGGATPVAVFAGEVKPRHEADLAFRVGGKVTSRSVDVGARVRRGQVLARLDPADVALQAESAKAGVAATETEWKYAAAEFDRYQNLHAQKFVSASALDQKRNARDAALARYDQAKAQLAVAQNQAAYATLVATGDGVITAVSVEAGQVVTAGQPVMKLADETEREIVIAVPENRLGELKSARQIVAFLWANPQRLYPATVREIAPSVDPVTRTFAVRVAVPSADAALQWGMTANVALTADGPADAALLPLVEPAPPGRVAGGLDLRSGDAAGRAAPGHRRAVPRGRRRRPRPPVRRMGRRGRRAEAAAGAEGAAVRGRRRDGAARAGAPRRLRRRRAPVRLCPLRPLRPRRSPDVARRRRHEPRHAARRRAQRLQPVRVGAASPRPGVLPDPGVRGRRHAGLRPARPVGGSAVHVQGDGGQDQLARRERARRRAAGDRQGRAQAAGGAQRRLGAQLLEAGRIAGVLRAEGLGAAGERARRVLPGAQEDRRHAQHAAVGHPGAVLQRRVRRHLHQHLRASPATASATATSSASATRSAPSCCA